MRVFYIFDMKPEFRKLYKNNESVLYGMLRQIYYLNHDNVTYGYNLFQQLTNRIDKEKIDYMLFLKMHQDIPYSKRDGKHRINNLYKDEVSILEVRHCYIKIEAEQPFSSFFKALSMISKNFFVCDFELQDYFFIQSDDTLKEENSIEYSNAYNIVGI